ncbi:alpha/beta fold hydrolase [Aquabacterium fontiphilum]|nr:alpha/beta fold hydrolase [Aquabacterium fontiphilum]
MLALVRAWHRQAQPWWRGVTTSWSWGLSPTAAQLAATDWWLHWASGAAGMQNWMNAATSSASAPGIPLLADATRATSDSRFAHPAWQQWPFNTMKEQYAQWSERLMAQARLEGMQPHHQQLMAFMTRQWIDMASPANWPWSNPEIGMKDVETLGMSRLKGMQLWLADLQALLRHTLSRRGDPEHAAPMSSPALPPLSHIVGRDVATTPGNVVMRNHLVELIQYAPSTPSVVSEPLLIVPSCIMKYYILDLSPHNSMVRYLRDQGFTVFMLSWRNPDEHDRELGMDDYLRQGLIDSMAAIRRLTGAARVHSLGYCLGGTFLAMAACLLAGVRREPDTRIKLDDLPDLASMTLLAAQTDFSEPGDLGVFIDPDQLHHLQHDMQQRGFLSGRQMAAAFQLLNAQDLIWARQTRRYLLGEEDKGMDLMSWNADATRLPARMHSEYLHELFLRNALAAGHARALGERLALIDIHCPMLVVGTEKDHVSPWKSVYKITLLTDTDTTFILASGGHNAGIVSEPGHPHRRHAWGHRPQGQPWLAPDHWLADATHCEGSWWPAMADWLRQHSDGEVAARVVAMRDTLAPAPGEYVKVRHAD